MSDHDGDETAIGEHVVRVEPDMVVIRLRGDYADHEQRRVTTILDRVGAERGALYILGDLRKLGRMSFEARRASADGVLRHAVAATAVVGASPHFRILATLGHRAAVLLGATRYPLRFMQSEEEARAWLRAERSKAK